MAGSKHLAERLRGARAKHKLGGPVSGCVTKCVPSADAFRQDDHGAYRRNGYNLIEGDKKRRKFYDRKIADLNAVAKRIGAASGAWKERRLGGERGEKLTVSIKSNAPHGWCFPDPGPKNNFKTANEPYPHNYHHMLPWASIYRSLKYEEARLVQMSGYNLNDGWNMIILPCFDKVALILGMFKHPCGHAEYNKAVARVINAAKAEIKGTKKKTSDHLTESQAAKLGEFFVAWEKNEFFVLMKKGREAADAQIDGAGRKAKAVNIDEFEPSGTKQAFDKLNKQ